jgi:4'-phosphopantetheinyl transferase
MDPAPWEDPPERPELRPGRLELWLVSLTAQPGEPADPERLLSAEERQALRLRPPALRLRAVRARSALRTILGAYLRERPEDLRLAAGPSGKPCLDGLQFNLSHAGEQALVAVSRDKRVGVDIENLREPPAMQEVISRFFTAGERAFIESHDARQRSRAFFLIWNRREAAAKALGMDLLASFTRLQVPVASCSTTGFLVNLLAQDYWLRDISPAPGYAGAFCLEGGPAELSWWRFRG